MPVLRINILAEDYKHLTRIDKLVTKYGGRLGTPEPAKFKFKTGTVQKGWAVDISLPDEVNMHEFTKEITRICCVYLPQQRRRFKLLWYAIAAILVMLLGFAGWYYLIN